MLFCDLSIYELHELSGQPIIYDDGIIDDENHDEELFQIQSGENDRKFVLVNTRIDYQYRSANLNNMCVYDFVSRLYKKKMNTTDVKYLSNIAEPVQETNQRGRPRVGQLFDR